jgi:hypothetical protein
MKIINLIVKHSTKIILALFLVLMVGFFAYTQSQKLDMKTLTLVSEEKFEGTSLGENWEPLYDGAFRYTGFYSNDQISVSDGQLKIKLSRLGGDKGNQIYSSVVRTKATFTSGYFEVTATLPKINEFNAIISLTNDSALENTDPASGAKIVFGSSNNQPYPFLASGVYYDNLGDPTETQNAFVLSLLYNEPHRYGLLWTETSYTFYLDGSKLWETKKTATSTEPLYLTLGFDFPMVSEKDNTTIDQTLTIDSVRIYSINP